jgi:molybdopterin-synthase adenylyltransferase
MALNWSFFMSDQITIPHTNPRYDRQRILAVIGDDGQEKLEHGRVAILGVGALGTHLADTLARAGVGFIRLVDRDVPELSNLQRQVLFSNEDVEAGIPKAAAAAERLRAVNPEIEVEPIVTDANPSNIERLIEDVDIALDGSDNFELRYLLNDAAIKLQRPWIYGGVIGTHGMTMTIRPGVTPCLRCVFPEAPAPGDAPTCDIAGVLGPAVSMVSAIQAAEAIKFLTGDTAALNRSLLMLDVWDLSFRRVALGEADPDCPACGKRTFEFLDRQAPRQTTELCGSDSIQIVIDPPPKLALDKLAERLQPIGTVRHNRYLLRFDVDKYQMTVFPDGRAIIKGTTNAAEARSIYARYIGM